MKMRVLLMALLSLSALSVQAGDRHRNDGWFPYYPGTYPDGRRHTVRYVRPFYAQLERYSSYPISERLCSVDGLLDSYAGAKERCGARYRSYDWDTDLYTTRRGQQRLCPYVRPWHQ